MLKSSLCLSALVLVTALPSMATAQTLNQPPQCQPKVVIMKGLPADTDLTSFQIDPITTAPACTDPDGDTLTLVSVSSQAYIEDGEAATDTTIKAGQGIVITFTVSDGNGGETTSTLTIKRE